MTRMALRQHRSAQFHPFTSPWLWLALAAPLWSSKPAAAAETCAELTCPQGYACQLAPGACPLIDCVGPDCPVCEPKPLAFCAAAQCNTNADCGEGMLCAEQVTTVCADIAVAPCNPNGECPPPRQPDCTSATTLWCTPRWQLPCSNDADCGAGFRCQEQESCSVPPSRGDAVRDPDGKGDVAPAPEPPPQVTCTATGTFACIAIETACSADGDCAPGWSCADNPSVTCSSSATGRADCTPVDPAKVCRPPYYDLPTSGPVAVATDSGGELVAAPTRDVAGNASGTPGVVSEADSSAPTVEGGCSLGTAHGSRSGLALFSLGLAALFTARRRRAGT
jgi:hypothetical protein